MQYNNGAFTIKRKGKKIRNLIITKEKDKNVSFKRKIDLIAYTQQIFNF